MRRPRPVPPKAKPAWEEFTRDELAAMALRASYVGSPYHKDCPNFTGSFAPRMGAVRAEVALDADDEPDCTICPRHWSRRQADATALLQQAIRTGQFAADATADGLPSRVWARDPERPEMIYEARRLLNTEGGYKAFPLTRIQGGKLPVRLP